MNKIEIKKALYKQKPRAQFDMIKQGMMYYSSMVLDDNNEPYYIKFEIPVDDMGDGIFNAEEDAKLLIRWIKG